MRVVFGLKLSFSGFEMFLESSIYWFMFLLVVNVVGKYVGEQWMSFKKYVFIYRICLI